MSKFNPRKDGLVKNDEGHKAIQKSRRLFLLQAASTSFFNEPKFYGDNSSALLDAAVGLIRHGEDEARFVANLAAYARLEMNLRSVSHALIALLAHEENGKKFVRPLMAKAVVRADDLTEILACYLSRYGKPLPNALKKALGEGFGRFDAYALAKYNGEGKIKFKDILNLTHPKPKDEAQSELFHQILEDRLPIPKTWETEVSRKGNKKEVWEALIGEDKLGYMALLRNLRNLLHARPANLDKALAKIADPEEVRKSRQLPFRFLSAYKEVKGHTEARNALEKALRASISSLPKIPGRSVIAIDGSGSMSCRLSANSSLNCFDVAKLLGLVLHAISEDTVVLVFHSDYRPIVHRLRIPKADYSILGKASAIRLPTGGTPLEAPFQYLLEHKRIRFDRMIILSDNETNYHPSLIQEWADKLRKDRKQDFWLHSIDLAGYQTTQFRGEKTNFIAGWSEKVLHYIVDVENGFADMEEAVDSYLFKKEKA